MTDTSSVYVYNDPDKPPLNGWMVVDFGEITHDRLINNPGIAFIVPRLEIDQPAVQLLNHTGRDSVVIAGLFNRIKHCLYWIEFSPDDGWIVGAEEDPDPFGNPADKSWSRSFMTVYDAVNFMLACTNSNLDNPMLFRYLIKPSDLKRHEEQALEGLSGYGLFS